MPRIGVREVVGFLVRQIILAVLRLYTGVQLGPAGLPRDAAQRIYFANHTSIADFLLIWAVMPPSLRRTTRTVAAEDYWTSSWLKRFLALDVFNALLISRGGRGAGEVSASKLMAEALRRGESLIIFPEGTRNTSNAWLTPFKCGLYHMAREHPHVQFIPVWLNNARHVMPKGTWLPLPLGCTVNLGEPLALNSLEQSHVFLARAQDAVLALKPDDTQAIPC